MIRGAVRRRVAADKNFMVAKSALIWKVVGAVVESDAYVENNFIPSKDPGKGSIWSPERCSEERRDVGSPKPRAGVT